MNEWMNEWANAVWKSKSERESERSWPTERKLAWGHIKRSKYFRANFWYNRRSKKQKCSWNSVYCTEFVMRNGKLLKPISGVLIKKGSIYSSAKRNTLTFQTKRDKLFQCTMFSCTLYTPKNILRLGAPRHMRTQNDARMLKLHADQQQQHQQY